MTMKAKIALAALAATAGLALAQAPDVLTGPASAADGDTLMMGGHEVRLSGVDAPEGDQLCQKDGKPYAVAGDAQKALAAIVAGKTLSCAVQSTDRQGRPIAVCKADGTDVQQAIVAAGWAYDYARFSKGLYAPQQAQAKAAKRGMWADGMECQPPWEWRQP
jgi:endonuclease YncB( thermonuclease family)